MNFAIFTYSFPHTKTADGVFHLLANGFKPSLFVAAPPVELTFPQSKRRLSPKGLHPAPPEQLANLCGAELVVAPHASEECYSALRRHNVDVGIILGARILKQEAIDCCSIGVINLHPGYLPDVRGLDTIKWAILKDLPMGATAHLIDSKIDMGRLLCRGIIDIYDDDTLLDLQLRTWDLERSLLIRGLELLQHFPDPAVYEPLGRGNYYKAVPPELERTLDSSFARFKWMHR